MNFSLKTTSVILAALRLLQRDVIEPGEPSHVDVILTNGGTLDRPTSDFIDGLCEYLNDSEPAVKTAQQLAIDFLAKHDENESVPDIYEYDSLVQEIAGTGPEPFGEPYFVVTGRMHGDDEATTSVYQCPDAAAAVAAFTAELREVANVTEEEAETGEEWTQVYIDTVFRSASSIWQDTAWVG